MRPGLSFIHLVLFDLTDESMNESDVCGLVCSVNIDQLLVVERISVVERG